MATVQPSFQEQDFLFKKTIKGIENYNRLLKNDQEWGDGQEILKELSKCIQTIDQIIQNYRLMGMEEEKKEAIKELSEEKKDWEEKKQGLSSYFSS